MIMIKTAEVEDNEYDLCNNQTLRGRKQKEENRKWYLYDI